MDLSNRLSSVRPEKTSINAHQLSAACWVPDCQFSLKNNQSKLLPLPSDVVQREIWLAAARRVVTEPGNRIWFCENHFETNVKDYNRMLPIRNMPPKMCAICMTFLKCDMYCVLSKNVRSRIPDFITVMFGKSYPPLPLLDVLNFCCIPGVSPCVNPPPVTCQTCHGNIWIYYTFKRICIDNERAWKRNLSPEAYGRLVVCRTCPKPFLDNVTLDARDELGRLLSEMFISNYPSNVVPLKVCKKCLGILNVILRFRNLLIFGPIQQKISEDASNKKGSNSENLFVEIRQSMDTFLKRVPFSYTNIASLTAGSDKRERKQKPKSKVKKNSRIDTTTVSTSTAWLGTSYDSTTAGALQPYSNWQSNPNHILDVCAPLPSQENNKVPQICAEKKSKSKIVVIANHCVALPASSNGSHQPIDANCVKDTDTIGTTAGTGILHMSPSISSTPPQEADPIKLNQGNDPGNIIQENNSTANIVGNINIQATQNVETYNFSETIKFSPQTCETRETVITKAARLPSSHPIGTVDLTEDMAKGDSGVQVARVSSSEEVDGAIGLSERFKSIKSSNGRNLLEPCDSAESSVPTNTMSTATFQWSIEADLKLIDAMNQYMDHMKKNTLSHVFKKIIDEKIFLHKKPDNLHSRWSKLVKLFQEGRLSRVVSKRVYSFLRLKEKMMTSDQHENVIDDEKTLELMIAYLLKNRDSVQGNSWATILNMMESDEFRSKLVSLESVWKGIYWRYMRISLRRTMSQSLQDAFSTLIDLTKTLGITNLKLKDSNLPSDQEYRPSLRAYRHKKKKKYNSRTKLSRYIATFRDQIDLVTAMKRVYDEAANKGILNVNPWPQLIQKIQSMGINNLPFINLRRLWNKMKVSAKIHIKDGSDYVDAEVWSLLEKHNQYLKSSKQRADNNNGTVSVAERTPASTFDGDHSSETGSIAAHETMRVHGKLWTESEKMALFKAIKIEFGLMLANSENISKPWMVILRRLHQKDYKEYDIMDLQRVWSRIRLYAHLHENNNVLTPLDYEVNSLIKLQKTIKEAKGVNKQSKTPKKIVESIKDEQSMQRGQKKGILCSDSKHKMAIKRRRKPRNSIVSKKDVKNWTPSEITDFLSVIKSYGSETLKPESSKIFWSKVQMKYSRKGHSARTANALRYKWNTLLESAKLAWANQKSEDNYDKIVIRYLTSVIKKNKRAEEAKDSDQEETTSEDQLRAIDSKENVKGSLKTTNTNFQNKEDNDAEVMKGTVENCKNEVEKVQYFFEMTPITIENVPKLPKLTPSKKNVAKMNNLTSHNIECHASEKQSSLVKRKLYFNPETCHQEELKGGDKKIVSKPESRSSVLAENSIDSDIEIVECFIEKKIGSTENIQKLSKYEPDKKEDSQKTKSSPRYTVDNVTAPFKRKPITNMETSHTKKLKQIVVEIETSSENRSLILADHSRVIESTDSSSYEDETVVDTSSDDDSGDEYVSAYDIQMMLKATSAADTCKNEVIVLDTSDEE